MVNSGALHGTLLGSCSWYCCRVVLLVQAWSSLLSVGSARQRGWLEALRLDQGIVDPHLSTCTLGSSCSKALGCDACLPAASVLVAVSSSSSLLRCCWHLLCPPWYVLLCLVVMRVVCMTLQRLEANRKTRSAAFFQKKREATRLRATAAATVDKQ